jgi:hypothetical protein
MPDNPPGAGRGGNVPPVEHRFPAGVSGNPKGRPTAGASIREWLNVLAADEAMTEPELRRLARDKAAPWPKRAAAERALKTLESGDLADFAGLLRGENNLEDLRGMGIDTAVVKRFKQKTRRVPTGKDGESEEVIEREIELHDRAGADFDRVCDRTEGKPTQRVDLKHEPSIRTTADGEAAADQLLDSIRAGLGADPGPA